MLRYAVRVLDDFRRRHPDAVRLPPIVALVVYHGERGWSRRTDLLELFDVEDALRPHLEPLLPNLRFLLDDLSREDDAALSARAGSALLRLFLLCITRIRHGASLRDELRRLAGAFRAAREAPDTGRALIDVLTYIAQVRDLSGDELYDLVLTEIGPEMEPDMTSTYDQLVNQGRAEGRAEARVEMLLGQLVRRFGELPAAVQDRVRGGTEEELRRWALSVLDARSLDDVFADA